MNMEMDNCILNPKPNQSESLSKLIKKHQTLGEHSIFPVSEKAFRCWVKENEDTQLPLQYADEIFTYTITERPHDASAGVITWCIIDSIRNQMPTGTSNELVLVAHTGLTTLHTPTPKSKNADSCIFTWQSGQENYWPGIVVEVEYSDSHIKSRRDMSLWLDYSNNNVKVGISAKIGVSNDQISTMKFDIHEMDYTATSATNRIGKSKVMFSVDMKRLKPNAITKYSIPSYAAFNDGIYPPSYPPHPNPPPPKPPITNANLPPRIRQYTMDELNILNNEINLHNNQRLPIDIDFSMIADRIEKIAIIPP